MSADPNNSHSTCKVQKANILSRVMRELHRYICTHCRAIDSQTLRTMKYFPIPAPPPPPWRPFKRTSHTDVTRQNHPLLLLQPPTINRTGLSIPMRPRDSLRAIIRCLYYAMGDSAGNYPNRRGHARACVLDKVRVRRLSWYIYTVIPLKQ